MKYLFLIIITSIVLSPKFSFAQSCQVSLEEIEKMVSTKNPSEVYELLIEKELELVRFEESDRFRGHWTYAYNYNKSSNTANFWVDYDFYDNKKQAKKFFWESDWRTKVTGDKTPQPTYAKNRIEFTFYDKNLFQKLTTQIKSQYTKTEPVFDETNMTYVFKYKSPDSEYIFHQIGESYYLLVSYVDRERENIINGYRNH